jgi:GAF domain-containing protein/anti-sigma regulatory factor (Ser/Thr protein kinase)
MTGAASGQNQPLVEDPHGSRPVVALSQMRQIESIADVALAHLELDAMLPELLDRVRDALSVDTVAVLLLEPETGEVVARAARGLEESVERGTRIPIGRGFAGRIAAERRPVTIPDVDDADIVNPIIREKGIRSLLGVPLIVAGHVLGVLHVGSLTPREFAETDTRLLELAAGRIGPAIEHVRLYEAERTARQEAEAALAELSALQSIIDAALGHLDIEEMLTEVLERVREALEADTVAILLLDPETNELVARAARGLEEEVERGVRIPVGRGFAGRIAAERRPVTIPDIDDADIVNPILREKGIRSLLGAPLVIRGRVTGVVHVGTLTHRSFTAVETRLLALAADRIAVALDHAQSRREHQMTLTLQRNLLPERLPEVSGLTLAARYRPGHGSMIGGDWYDAVPLPSGGVGLAMGDVVSGGIRAASVMGQLRHALRTFAVEGEEPTALAERLARLVRSLDRREMATLSYAAVDASGGELTYVSAGHPPPLVVEDGRARFLEDARGAPLGALPHPRYERATVALAPDSLIILYTDGLVERRGRPLDEGLDRLAAVAERGIDDPERLADELIAELVDDDTRDDVALIVARTVTQRPERFEVRLPAVSGSLAALRRSLRQWLRQNGATEDDVIETLIAVGEAAGNAVEHAYGPEDAIFDVTAALTGREMAVTVRDYGTWRPPRGQNRGRGTALMQQLMDEFEVRTTRDGTEVRLRRRLGQGPSA